MILEYINKDNIKEKINFDTYTSIDNWVNIESSYKLDFIKKFIPAFQNGQKIVLFDKSHKQLSDYYKNNIDFLNNIESVYKSQLLFFTSGSTGFPIGAFKTRENLLQEVMSLKSILNTFKTRRVVVTVPFMHIYGILVGLLLPMHLENTTLIIKDDFLPYELLNEASKPDTLIVTTPLFIKALSKLNTNILLKNSLFISSTGPLFSNDVKIFEEKYNTNLMQLFGSTETGGIAYKYSDTDNWTPLPLVDIGINNDRLEVSSPFISNNLLDKKIINIQGKFITEDIIELNENGFKLIGRSNKIIKISGKRISTIQIERFLEDIDEIDKVIVEVVYKKDLLRSEQLRIIIQSLKKLSKKTIKNKISEHFGVLNIPFDIVYVKEIVCSSMGKKIHFNVDTSLDPT